MPVHIQLVIYLAIVATVFSIGLGIMAWGNHRRIEELKRALANSHYAMSSCSKETNRLAEMVSVTSSAFVNLGEALAEMIYAVPTMIEEIEVIEQKEREAQALFAAAWPDVPAWIYEETPTLKKLADQIMEIENGAIDLGDEEEKERGEEYYD